MKVRTLVRVPCTSRAEAKDLALRLAADEYRNVGRRFRLVTAEADTEADAERLIRALHLCAAAGELERRQHERNPRANRPAPAVGRAAPVVADD